MKSKLYEEGLNGTTERGIGKIVSDLILFRDCFIEYQGLRYECEHLRGGYVENGLTEHGLEQYNSSLARLDHHIGTLKLRTKWLDEKIQEMLPLKKLKKELNEICGGNHEFSNYFFKKIKP